MTVTMKDIAKLAGVSQQAVSAALNRNGTSKVSTALRCRIQDIAAELNYAPNSAARRLKGCATKTIGIHGVPYVSVLMQSFFLDLSLLFYQHGYNLLSCYGIDEQASRRAANELVAKGVDGIIFTAGSIEDLDGKNVPFVFSPPVPAPGFDVTVDLAQGCRLAVEHLHRHGRRRIGFAGIGTANASANREKIRGMREALAKCGLPAIETALFSFGDYDNEPDAIVRHLRELSLEAVCCANDYIAAKLTGVLLRAGFRVPDDIAIVGYDGLTMCDFCSVPLATVIQPIRRQAELTVDLMLQRINEKNRPFQPARIAVPPRFYPSISCGCSGCQLDRLPLYETHATLEQQQNIGNTPCKFS